MPAKLLTEVKSLSGDLCCLDDMTVNQRARWVHAAVACGSILAYLTGELGLIHAWLGYAVAGVLGFRLLWSLVGHDQAGVSRYFIALADAPAIRWLDHPALAKLLIAGILTSLLAVSATGIAIDRLKSLPGRQALFAMASADDHHRGQRRDDESESPLGELHEASANLLLVLAGLHAFQGLLFRRRLAFYMLFFSNGKNASSSRQAPHD